MEGGDAGDDRNYIVNFSSDGVGKLREAVKEKLMEFLGDYSDDTLVEYVIVLLKSGRCKEEAKNELDVFLGDETDSFITWLWDHIGSSLHVYSQSLSTQSDKVGNVELAVQDSVGKNDSHKMGSESEEGRSKKLCKPRHRRQWKGLVGDVKENQILKSSIAESDPSKEDSHIKRDCVKLHDSLHEGAQRKRFRSEVRGSNKVLSRSVARGSDKEGFQQAAIFAPRRLLQFAVRDAVSASITEPSLKRLQYVVSAASEDTALDQCMESCRPVTRVSNNMSTVIKAVAEDVQRVGPLPNVFERLSHATGVSDISEQLRDFGEDFFGDRYVRPHNKMDVHSPYHIRFREQYVNDTTLLPREAEMAPESIFEYDGYNDMEIRGRGVFLSSEVRKKAEDSLMFPYDMANNADRRSQKTISSLSVPDDVQKIVTWKSPQYRETRENVKLDSNKSKAENNALAVKSNVPAPTHANEDCAMLGNCNVKSEAGIAKESHKMQLFTHGPYSSGPPTDGSDSRIIFVSNVHFAATKDSLSQNFNKFGEVLKVIILSNPATGLPKGSAYVEFMRKEAAEHALSLDGTSFMSRILKVVRKSAAPQEPSSTLRWPRAARLFPYPISGFSMTPFPRGVPNVYRARPLKPGARSLQWKRDMQTI